MKKWRGVQQGNVPLACREHVKADESCPNLYEVVFLSLWEVGERSRKSYTGWFQFDRDNGSTASDSDLFEGICKASASVLQTSPALQTPAVKHVVHLKSDNSRTGFHHRCHYCLHRLCNCWRGPGQSKDGYLSITVPPSHPLSTSERCVLLLISSTCQKLGEQLLGRTAALLILDT